MHPTEVRLTRDRRSLSIAWDGGMTTTLPATLLREQARDADALRTSLNGWSVPAHPDLTIERLDTIGNYAIRIGFSDGHDRGIFPWSYLAQLAANGSDGASPR